MRSEATLQAGTLTLLLTDIAGSSQLWERHPNSMKEAIARRKEIADLDRKIERQMGHLEAEDPQTAIAKALRKRLEELIDVKTKRERELSIASKTAAERTTKEGAAYLLECLPLLDVDHDMFTEEDFR